MWPWCLVIAYMKIAPDAEEILDIMRLAVADLDNAPEQLEGHAKAAEYNLFDLVFAAATARG
jgi:hypothetical protein